MQIFSILDRYISKTIFSTIMTVLFILVSLSGMIKFLDQLKKAGEGSYDTFGAGIYTLLSVPKDIHIFSPMAALIGALLGLGGLAQCNELIVMQASGYTRMQVAFSVMKTAIPLILLSIVIGECVAPHAELIARNYRAKAIFGGSFLSIQEGLWVKDSKNFIHIKQADGNYELLGVTIYAFNENYRLQSVRYAEKAKFDPRNKLWCLLHVNEISLQDRNQLTDLQIFSSTWETKLTPDKLGILALGPDALSITTLYKYIKYLMSSGQDVSRYQLNMWGKFFQPISVAVMILMALSFIFGPLRSVSIGGLIVTGISCGFLFYVLDRIIGPLTLVCGISPIIGTLLPSGLFFLISIWLLLRGF